MQGQLAYPGIRMQSVAELDDHFIKIASVAHSNKGNGMIKKLYLFLACKS